MKKQLLNLSFTAVALAMYVVAIAAPFEPVATMEVPAAAYLSAPVMDGTADDVYSEPIATDFFSQPEDFGGEADFNATFRVCYDPAYLYVLIEITDDEDISWEGTGDPWTFDNAEFFFQLDTNTVVTTYDDETVQLRVNRNVDSVTQTGHVGADAFALYMEGDAVNGWIAEVAIPWSCALAEGTILDEEYLAKSIGFDFSGADADQMAESNGDRESQVAWDMDGGTGQEDDAWQNTSVFGYITLAANDWTDFSGVEAQTENNLKAYPNPATSEITFNVEGEVAVEIYSITGSLVMVANEATVDVSSLNSGMYVARIGNQSIRFAVK